MAQKEVVIVEAVRTAFGRMGGTLKDIHTSKLGTIGIDGLLQKTKIMEKAHVDSVFLG
ncbi:MAG: acetyl-CoA C-acyltransferase, partial [Deltaproteobacteria bacterium]|nr:acetyl-CoA C-acyltransferase [Deltaproteobacteria bacterium]